MKIPNDCARSTHRCPTKDTLFVVIVRALLWKITQVNALVRMLELSELALAWLVLIGKDLRSSRTNVGRGGDDMHKQDG